MPKIDFTVLIPVFNTKAAELIEAVFSVHNSNQTVCEDYENPDIKQEYDIVLVDDGSTLPETCHALEYLKIALGVHVIHMPVNGGTSKALNAGHEYIKTEYIAIMGSSDVSFKNRFELQTKHLLVNPNIDVLGTRLISFAESDPLRKVLYTNTHEYTTTLAQRSEGWLTNHGTVIYKNQSVKDVGGYILPGRYQDVDLWKRMSLAGKKIHTLADITYGWRKSGV